MPIVSMSEQFMMANAAAARLLDGTDQVVLWEQAYQAIARRSERSITVVLADRRVVTARCSPVDLGGRSIGVLIEFDPTPVKTAVRRAPPPHEPGVESEFIGVSRAWQELTGLVRKAALAPLAILFVGEPGTGKSSLALHAHRLSGVDGPFRVHDGALVGIDGADEWLRNLRADLVAGTGTVLIKHLLMLDGTAADALSGLLDGCPGTPRLMATVLTPTSAEPRLQPLLDRFVVRVSVPPLRERPDDVKALATEFLRRSASHEPPPRLAPEALQALLRLDWPGNVRQLQSVIARLAAAGRRSDVQLADLPEDIRRQTARRQLTRLEQVELEQILVALRQTNGNKADAARVLGISRATLYRKIQAFGILLEDSIF